MPSRRFLAVDAEARSRYSRRSRSVSAMICLVSMIAPGSRPFIRRIIIAEITTVAPARGVVTSPRVSLNRNETARELPCFSSSAIPDERNEISAPVESIIALAISSSGFSLTVVRRVIRAIANAVSRLRRRGERKGKHASFRLD